MVPAGAFASGFEAVTVGGGADDIDSEVPDNSHVVGAMAFAQAREVFPEDKIEHPVKAVLDAPMAAHRRGETRRIERGREDVIAPFDRCRLSTSVASIIATAASLAKRIPRDSGGAISQ